MTTPPSIDLLGHRLGVTTKFSPDSVTETVDRLCRLIADRNLELFAVIDQRARARGAGLALRETTLVIFGSPAAGTPVMDAVALAALDLPLKVLIWADGERTAVSYLSPQALAERYELTPALAGPLAGIDPITDQLVGPAPNVGEP